MGNPVAPTTRVAPTTLQGPGPRLLTCLREDESGDDGQDEDRNQHHKRHPDRPDYLARARPTSIDVPSHPREEDGDEDESGVDGEGGGDRVDSLSDNYNSKGNSEEEEEEEEEEEDDDCGPATSSKGGMSPCCLFLPSMSVPCHPLTRHTPRKHVRPCQLTCACHSRGMEMQVLFT